MKRSWVWVWAAIAVVCLLWSLVLQASMNPASSFEKHWVAPGPENRILLRLAQACESYAEAGFTVVPVCRNFSLPPMCYCVLRIWILRDRPGWNLADPRVDIGTLGDLVGL